MRFLERKIPGLYDVQLDIFVDERGSLLKPFNAEPFKVAGFEPVWKQTIISHTKYRNTVRGLYVQTAPYTEGKLVSPMRGRMWWVAVDVRKNSPTFGRWDASTICPERNTCLFIAPGFAHGCYSLTDDADVLLLADNEHSQEHGVGIAWDDPELAVNWPLLGGAPVISEAHKANKSFANFKSAIGGI